MGAGYSREPDEELASGVRITKDLLDQLSGRMPRPVQRVPPLIVGDSLKLQPKLPTSEESDAAALTRQDRSLAHALERSRRVGDMLLKQDVDEVHMVGQLASELLEREYQAPSRPLPCQEQAAACLQCYAEHASDTLSCAAAVRMYSECTQAAWAAAMAKT